MGNEISNENDEYNVMFTDSWSLFVIRRVYAIKSSGELA